MADYLALFNEGVRKGEDFPFHMVENEECFLVQKLNDDLAIYSCLPFGHEVVAKGGRAVSLPKEEEA
jgi:hypothetical protein